MFVNKFISTLILAFNICAVRTCFSYVVISIMHASCKYERWSTARRSRLVIELNVEKGDIMLWGHKACWWLCDVLWNPGICGIRLHEIVSPTCLRPRTVLSACVCEPQNMCASPVTMPSVIIFWGPEIHRRAPPFGDMVTALSSTRGGNRNIAAPQFHVHATSIRLHRTVPPYGVCLHSWRS